jgi:cellobiose epimerase
MLPTNVARAVSFSGVLIVILISSFRTNDERERIAKEMEFSLKNELLDKWYPRAIDTAAGGFLTTFTYDFKPTAPQDKMIVTQARHIWTNAKASVRFPTVAYYKSGARHGFQFLKNFMWDKKHGGFYTLVDRYGNVKTTDTIKTAYGNAFAIYALAAYFAASGDTSALNLAKQAFL